MVVAIIIGCVAVPLIVFGLVRYRRTVRNRRVNELYEAASTGDLTQWSHAVDVQDSEGNTALHLAYYRGQQDAIAALVAYGADDNLRNNEHLTPAEMGVMATIELQLRAGAKCLSHGEWVDSERGRVIYDKLREQKPRIYNPALVRCVLTGKNRTSLLHLAIKLGIRGSEKRLAQALHGYGTREMATDYLNAGSKVLREAAEAWAKRNGYEIVSFGGARTVSWGRF